MNTDSKKTPILLLVTLIGIVLLVITGLLYSKKSEESEVTPLTITEGQRIAESISPYIPKGYSITHKAKRVDFASGGTLFDTQLTNGTDKIGILMVPAEPFECETVTKQQRDKSLCITELGTTKSIKWTKGLLNYEIISASVDLPITELEKIAETIK